MNTGRAASRRLAQLSAEQASMLSSWQGALLVLGGPGTGKTTLLAHAGLSRLAEPGPDPVLLAGSRQQASRLRNLITAELGEGTWRPRVTTVHALARSLWQRFSGRAEMRLLDAAEQEFRVREVLSGAGLAHWPDDLHLAIRTKGFAAQVRAVLARTRQLGLEPEDIVAFGEAAQRPEWSAVGTFFSEYLDVLDAEGVFDYAELIHRVRILLRDQQVADVLSGELSAVLVDDFAELDPSQIGLVADLATGVPILATADPDSVSATFRGADPRAVRDFEEIFSRPGIPARVGQLAEGHRLGAAMEAALAGVRSRLPRVARPVPPVSSVIPGSLGSVRPEGQVLVLTCADEAEQARAIAAELRRARLDQGIEFGQMAVLVRSGRGQLGAITRALLAAGVPVEVAAEEIPLAQAPAVRPLLLALAVVARGVATPDEAVRLLTGPLGGLDAVGLRGLARSWRATRQDQDAYQPLGEQVATALNDPSWAVDSPPSGEADSMMALANLMVGAKKLLADGEPVDVVAWHLWQGTDWPGQLAAESAQGGAAASRADADLDAMCAFFELVATADRRGGVAGVRAFLAELGGQRIPADRERESRLRRRGVQVLTTHRSRGQEWDVVVVAGVQEGIWPAGRRVNAVLDAGELSVEGISSNPDSREALAAERRLFHLACSRARSRLIVIAAAGTEGESNSPSRFLAELGVPAQRARWGGTPVTLNALVAELRRWSTNPAATEAVRAAAAIELGRLAAASDVSGRSLVPAANPRGWWGVREVSSRPVADGGPIRLSPSQVNAALTCPRRYFLARQAGGEGGTSLAATLGSLVHRLVQQAVSEGWGTAQLSGHLDQIWDRLPFEAAWFSASERVEVELALGRFLTWRANRDAELLAVEAPFQVQLELDAMEVLLTGQVDWLERTDTGLRVVDFKTSKRQPTKEEILGMEQLGVYQLAITSGGFAAIDACFGEVASAGASAVYLRQAARGEDGPKEFRQPRLDSSVHLSEDAAELAYPTWVHHRVAAAARVIAEGNYPATPGVHCQRCPFASSCPAVEQGRQVLR